MRSCASNCSTSAAARSANMAARGCHDIPGYEDMKPIGTGLADWGRKAADKLAFEQITQYILHGHGHDTPLAERPRGRSGHGLSRSAYRSRAQRRGRAGACRRAARARISKICAPADRLLHGKAVRPRARRVHLAKTPRAAQLRLQKDREQGLQRAAADAAVQSRRPAARASDHLRAWACWPSRRLSNTSTSRSRAAGRSPKARR